MPASPLVSVIITAFNPRYYGEALESAQRQTYKNLEIIVGDDCLTDDVRRITVTRARSDQRIRYTRNDPSLGGPANRIACFERAMGPLVKFLNDDDLLQPDCVRRMAACLQDFPSVALVTSHWQRIDENGSPLPDDRDNGRPVGTDSVLSGRSAAASMIRSRSNFIGPPSAVMFRRADLADARPHILSFAGTPCVANGDVTMWTHLLGKGSVIYLVESLSCFRVHAEQMMRRPGYDAEGSAAWDRLAAEAARVGLVGPKAPAALDVRPLGPKPWYADEVLVEITAAGDALEREDWAQACEHLSQALRSEPRDPWLVSARACVLSALGDTERARVEMRRAESLHYPVRVPVEVP